MKLTKKKKEEVLEIYTIWLHSYLNGDVATYHQYLDDAYHFIGSTNNEEFLDRNATTTFFKATADQLAGKCQLKEEKKTVEAFGDLVFITHVFDAWFLNGSEWTYYSRFRFSSVLQEKKHGWRFIYQHFSTTDNKADEGETIGFDKVNLENQELREAIKRRTLELEAKNRELEIEAALERVRSRSMAMHTSDELEEVSALLDNEVGALGIETWGCAFNIYGEKDSSEWFSTQAGVMPPYKTPRENIFKKYYNIGQQGETFHIQEFKGKKCVAHYEYLCTLPEAGEALRAIKASGGTFPTYQLDHVAFFKQGYLLFITLAPVPEAENIFPRFAKVFEQAYTRFLDLKKAEAQAREAQIEAALERVRSASMAMHKTEDLSDVVMVYFEQLKHLDIDFIQSWITIFHLDKGYVDVWFSPLEGIYDKPRHFKMPSALFENTSIKSWKAGLPFSYVSFPNKENVDEFMQVCDDVTNSNYFGKTQDMLQLERFEMVDANHKYGCISKSNTTKASEEDEVILQRFANVFEQTYTRFLDLQKAEAQAREKEIELVLEKVRSKTMAMQNSEELQEVILEVLKKLQGLRISMEQRAAAIFTYEAGNKEYKQWVASPEYNSILSFNTPYFDHPVQNDIWNARQNGTAFYAKPYPVEVKNSLFKYMFDLPALKNMPKAEKTKALKFKHYAISIAFQKHAALVVVDHSGIPLTEAENSILIRLSKVFNQTYTRFLDLQKAEDQARESQIQLSLERVRAKSMAMQSSSELETIIQVVHDQFVELGITLDHAGFIIDYKSNDDMIIWLADEHKVTPQIRLPYFDSPHWNSFITAKEKGHKLFVNHLDFKTKNKFYKQIFKYVPELPEDARSFYLKIPSLTIATSLIDNIGLYIENFSGVQYGEEDQKVLLRFGEEFQQAYTRFLDLQKAEAQAREAQIQLSLERVRAKSMAMQSSDELHDVIGIVFQQFDNLAIQPVNVFLSLFDRQKRMLTYRASGKSGKRMPTKQDVDIDSVEAWTDLYNKWINDSSDDIEVIFYPKEIVPDILNLLKDTFLSMPKKDRMTTKDFPNGGYSTLGYTPFGYLGYDHTRPPTDEEKDILKRICTEFGRLYQRFLDIKKAEAQAREAQIEAALERTRTQSMLMQRSDELSTTTQVFHEQLRLLGIDSEFSYLWLPDEDEKNHLFWATWDEQKKRKTVYRNKAVTFPLDKSEPSIEACYLAWESGETVHVNAVAPNEVKDYFNTWSELLDGVTKFQPELFPDGLFYIDAYMDYGCFGIMIKQQLDDNEKNILGRFSKEFQRTYTRFLDLKKAEAQAREAQIEAALEKVRSRSLAMQKSDELLDVIGIVSEQLHALRLKFDTICFGESNKDGAVKFWLTSKGLPKPILIDVPPIKNKGVQRVVKAQKDGLKFLADVITGKTYTEWNNHMLTNSQLQYLPKAAKTYLARTSGFARSSFFLKEIALYAMNYQIKPFSDADNAIFNRFAQVFDQSYTRFLDLKKAEAQARESQIEAALEKVRSRTMAMQHSDELPEAANNLFLQVQALGIPAWSAGYCIWEKDQKSALCHMSSEGEVQKAFSLPTIGEGYNFYDPYKKGETFHVSECGGENLVKHYDFMKTLPTVGAILEELEKAGLSLPTFQIFHIVFFKFGYVMFITYETVPDAHHIFKRFGQVFEQTYTRFLDLKLKEDQAVKLEEEKRRLEKTLKDLQETQKQLIQSEKMASLGELTAGIAHEIQNPLNFVNNFSEVSKELLEEMQEEIENGDFEEVKAIMDDVIQNLEKINHHGKRADGIVKGMLQHSRSSSGTKEPTDINALADEYLRLAYHGLRAKDKSFNAELVTDFDEAIGKINVLPQDMGRVILNLITNAFYASNERKQASKDEGFKPTVSVSTKKLKSTIEISVKDNGNGIPAAIVDKIFQPFFTTKPTGQGTGLGLSMSYDIVTKGHGGELTVSTNEKQGSEFTISLKTKPN